MGEGLPFLLDVPTDVAGKAEDLSDQGQHLYLHSAIVEDLVAGLQCPLMWRNEDNVHLLILQHAPCVLALQSPLGGDAAVDVASIVCDFGVEVGDLDALVPVEVELVLPTVVQVALVELGLSVPDDDQFAW